MTLDEFFEGHEESRLIFDAVRSALDAIGPTELRIGKSEVAFWRRKSVARVWVPAHYLRGKVAPLALTISLRSRDTSPRWKEIVEPSPGHFTHHLELYCPADVDDEVRNWLRGRWTTAA